MDVAGMATGVDSQAFIGGKVFEAFAALANPAITSRFKDTTLFVPAMGTFHGNHQSLISIF